MTTPTISPTLVWLLLEFDELLVDGKTQKVLLTPRTWYPIPEARPPANELSLIMDATKAAVPLIDVSAPGATAAEGFGRMEATTITDPV